MTSVRNELRGLGLTKGVLSLQLSRRQGRLGATYRDRAILRALKKKRIAKADLPHIRQRLTQYDDAAWIVTSFKKAHDQVTAALMPASLDALARSLDSTAPPKTGPYWTAHSTFTKVSNRRYQPDNFHLSAITTDPWDDTLPAGIGRTLQTLTDDRAKVGLRFRWFKAPALPSSPEPSQELVGFDATASQVQIIALLAGLTNLEKSFENGGDFRKALAKDALPFMRPEYEGPRDEKLVVAMKDMVMTRFYGRKIHAVVNAHWADPERFGPGWRSGIHRYGRNKVRVLARRALTPQLVAWARLLEKGTVALGVLNLQKLKRKARRQAIRTLATRYAAHRADEVLDAMPDREGVEKFLLACRRLALLAYRKEQGATLTDPLDAGDPKAHGLFTWDPIPYRASNIIARSEGIGPTLGIPIEGPGGKSAARTELQNRLSPCLVHTLDSYALSLVILELQRREVQCFATVHDCVYVPHRIATVGGGSVDGLELLAEVMEGAARDWYRGLGATFADLERYLGDDQAVIPRPKAWRLKWTEESYAGYVSRLKETWQDRVASEDWPRFSVKPSRANLPASVVTPNGPLEEEGTTTSN